MHAHKKANTTKSNKSPVLKLILLDGTGLARVAGSGTTPRALGQLPWIWLVGDLWGHGLTQGIYLMCWDPLGALSTRWPHSCSGLRGFVGGFAAGTLEDAGTR